MKASTSVFASSIGGPILGKAAASWSRTLSQVAATVAASGWAKIVRNTAATMSLWDLGHQRQQVAGEVDPAALVAGPLQDAAQCGYQAAVLVGDHQLGALEAAFLQGAQEAAPKHLVFGVADIDAQHLAAAWR